MEESLPNRTLTAGERVHRMQVLIDPPACSAAVVVSVCSITSKFVVVLLNYKLRRSASVSTPSEATRCNALFRDHQFNNNWTET